MNSHDVAQRSDAWFACRLGKATASRAKDVLATIKTGEAAARRDYRMQLVVERITGAPAEDVFVNGDMQRGIDQEPIACGLYESQTGNLVEAVGFMDHPTIAMCGASPDGRMGDVGLEIKCPRAARHIQYFQGGIVPVEYLPQIAMQAACGGFSAVEFVSYCAVMPEKLRLFVARWERNDVYVASLENALRQFLEEVSRDEAQVRRLAA